MIAIVFYKSTKQIIGVIENPTTVSFDLLKGKNGTLENIDRNKVSILLTKHAVEMRINPLGIFEYAPAFVQEEWLEDNSKIDLLE